MRRYHITGFLLTIFLAVFIFTPRETSATLTNCAVGGVVNYHPGQSCPAVNPCNPLSQSCFNCNILKGPPDLNGWVCVNLPPAQPIPDEVKTEIGLLKAQPDELIKALTLVLVGLSGGISLFLTISGAVKYLLSSGNPEAVEEARSTIVHAAGGFILVILSVFLLRFIGIDLLHIPGFSASPGGGVDVPYP